MRSFTRIGALAAFAGFLLPASAATVVSESRITVTGGAIAGETFTLSRVNGDWFVTPGDAHASLTLSAGAGAQRTQLNIQWDGKGATHTIRAENNDDVGGDNRFTFFLHLGAPYSQIVQPRGADAIDVTVIRMDDLNLEANIAGTATGAGSLRITGVIKLHRDAANAGVSGAYLNCDPAIHDKLAGAEARSATECEVKFDLHLREALANAFAPAVTALTRGEWEQSRKPNMGPITSIARGSEKSAFGLDSSREGAFRLEFRLRPGSAQAMRNQAAMEAAMKKMSDMMKTGGVAAASIAELTLAAHAAQGSGTIGISVGVNQATVGIVNFQGTHSVSQVPGVGYLLTAPYVQANTGGDIGSSHETTYVFVGGWAPPTNTRSDGGSEDIVVKGSLVKGSLNAKGPALSVQNICVQIQANAELAQQVIGLVDWSAIQQLLAGK